MPFYHKPIWWLCATKILLLFDQSSGDREADMGFIEGVNFNQHELEGRGRGGEVKVVEDFCKALEDT